MQIDVASLAAKISTECCLEFVGTGGHIEGGGHRYILQPAHHPPAHTFSLNICVGWRSLEMEFRPGNFASSLLQAMGAAEPAARAGFVSVLLKSAEDGAEIGVRVNGADRSVDDPSIWTTPWLQFSLSIRKGMLPFNYGSPDDDIELVATWVSRLSAAVLALLPLEAEESLDQLNSAETVVGLPEGSRLRVEVNRYERDRRNRAAALAIHGRSCKACGIDMGHRYGPSASGLIEVHHTTPVSQLGPNYIIDPRDDLVPLCPNCHAVAHRKSPPFTVAELISFLARYK